MVKTVVQNVAKKNSANNNNDDDVKKKKRRTSQERAGLHVSVSRCRRVIERVWKGEPVRPVRAFYI